MRSKKHTIQSVNEITLYEILFRDEPYAYQSRKKKLNK